MMLSCRDVTEQATDAEEGALPPLRRLLFRLHVLVCRHCRAYLRQMRQVRALLRTLGEAVDPAAGATPALAPSLRSAFREASARRPR
jgi:hypothetical protein